MTDRERLIDLIEKFGDDIAFCDICKRPDSDCDGCRNERIADYLIEHGVIVLPCKVGDIVYTTYNGSVSVYRVIELVMNGLLWAKLYNPDYSLGHETTLACLDYSFNEFVFLTREEAEEKLKECKRNV